MCCRNTAAQIAGQRVGVFSYGSGFAATLYSLRVTQDHTPGQSAMMHFSCVMWIKLIHIVIVNIWFVSGSGLDKLVSSLSDLKARLDSRRKVSPAVFSENMKLREETHHLGMTLPSLLHVWSNCFLHCDIIIIVINLFSLRPRSQLRPSRLGGGSVPRDLVPDTSGWETPQGVRPETSGRRPASRARSCSLHHGHRGTGWIHIQMQCLTSRW